MRVAIHSQSASVRRTLETLLVLSGHTLAVPADAELHVIDGVHPPASKPIPTNQPITLGGTSAGALSTPLQIGAFLQALTRAEAPVVVLAGGWSLDSAARCLVHPDQPAQPLTEKESSLLAALAASPSAIGRERLLADVWDMAEAVETHTLETHIYRLRAKLATISPPPADVVTEGGSYRLVIA